ncbi:MAG: hypothetical protein V3U09_08345, partial [Thermoplasmata archaeon]
MTRLSCRPVAFVLVSLMVLSFVWSSPGSPDVIRDETSFATMKEGLTADEATVTTEWKVDGMANVDSAFMSKIQTDLRERIVSLGSEPVKVVVFADSISIVHEALRAGKMFTNGDVVSTDEGLGTTILELPANVIPKVASLSNVRAILDYELPQPPDPRDFWQGPYSGDAPSPQMWQVTLTQG